MALAVLAAGSPPAKADDTARSEGPPQVVVIQESNGFPGGEQATALARQKVSIRGDRLSVIDESHRWALVVSIPDRKVQEAAIDAREYVERDFAYYEKYREDRRRNRQEQVARFREMLAAAPDRNAEIQIRRDAARMGLPTRPDGQTVARLERFPQDRRTATILVDRQPRQVTLDHYRIRENEAEKPAFDLWVTQDVTLPVDVLRFYRELGTFGEEVSQKLLEVPGVVIECQAVLDTGTFSRTFDFKVLELRTEDAVPEYQVRIPSGWSKVDEEARAAERERQARLVRCEVCGRELDRSQATTFVVPARAGRPGRTTHFCGSAHRAEFIQRLGRE